MARIKDILCEEEIAALKEDLNDLIINGGSFMEIEDLLLGYGLEMDYIEDLMWC